MTDKGESALGPISADLTVDASPHGAWQWLVNKLGFFGKFGNTAIVLKEVPRKGRQGGTTKRRIYRSRNGSAFARVAEIPDNTTTTYTDNRRLDGTTPLPGLGTDWDFKDNWVNSVTIGSGALIALLAASNVLEAILGSKPDEAAISLLAVTAALSAVFVGISPLVVKLFGEKLSVPTIGGTLLAAWVTLVGAVGQITAVTWQAAELVSRWWVHLGMVLLGVVVAALVLGYAWRALWHFIKAGSEDLPSKRSDALVAADAVTTSIKLVATSNRLAANVVSKAITLAKKPDDDEAPEDLEKAEEEAQVEHKHVAAEQQRIQKALQARERSPQPAGNPLL